MKKILAFLLVVLATVSMGATAVYADEASQGKVYLRLEFPVGLMADSYITLRNTATNEDEVILIPAKDKGTVSFTKEFGTYTVVDSLVRTIDGVKLNYSVVLADFTLNEENSGEGRTLELVGNVRNNVLLGKDNPTPTPAGQNSIFNYRIAEDNAYFPGMTIPEIQEWYTKEATKFVNSGKSATTVEELQADVTRWADWVIRKKQGTLETKYSVEVEYYNTAETKEFYEAQKKIYDFLWGFYKETGKTLNLDKWVYETPTPAPTPTPEPTATPVPTATPAPTPTPVPTPKTEEQVDSGNEPMDGVLDNTVINVKPSQNTEQNDGNGMMIGILIGVLCLVAIGIVVVVMIKKNKK